MKARSGAAQASPDHVVVLKVPTPGAFLHTMFATAATRRALVAEMLGTLLFVFVAAGTTLMTAAAAAERGSLTRVLVVALAHGLAFALAVAATSRLSGGHLNPAITAGAVATGRMPMNVGAMFVAAQVVGAVLAAVLLKAVVPGAMTNGLGGHVLGPRVTPEAAIVVEAVVTFALVLAFLATANVARATAPMVLGAVVALGHLFAMPLTGASMNPARSFGPALVAGAWTAQWVYWIGPLLGAGLAALAWKWAFAGPHEKEPRIINGDDPWRD